MGGDQKKVTVHPVALSDGAGTATLHVPVDERGIEHDASASINAGVSARTRRIKIPVASLDSFNFDNLDFIKIDTEGHESSVLAGAVETIKRCTPALLIEIEQRHNWSQPIASIVVRLASFGYSGFFLKDGRLISIELFDAARDQSEQVLEIHSRNYINNFLFLNNQKIELGKYKGLFARWMPN